MESKVMNWFEGLVLVAALGIIIGVIVLGVRL